MIKMISNGFILSLSVLFSVATLSAADTLVVTWTGTPGEMENIIMADTSADGTQANDVYVLESNKVYLQQSTLILNSGCELTGAPYSDSERPAEVKPILGADGESQFNAYWPAGSIKTYGDDQTYKLSNLLFNGVFAGGSGTLHGVLATYGNRNTIHVDKVTSVHSEVITYWNFGKQEDWVITNCKAVQYSCYPAGMYFGGFFWGGGAWAGTLNSLKIQNNTIEGAHGQGFVIWDNGLVDREPHERILIDHNTFVNIIDWPKFTRGGNNTYWTNNLMVNTVSNGQSRNAAANVTLNNDRENGMGKMATLSQGFCQDSAWIANQLASGNQWCYDREHRNIVYENNGFMDTPELLAMFNMDPWCWNLKGSDGTDSLDANGTVVTMCDTMIANQSKWIGDSTTAQLANGVRDVNNIHVSDLGWNLDPIYIETQILRTVDWLDNGVHDTHTDRAWMHQADGDYEVVEWPLPMDFSYSTSSAAYTHGRYGYPLGDLNAFPSVKVDWDANVLHVGDDMQITPAKFELAQNFPNPFNPTTDITFSIDRAANVDLSIYNMLGQKVRTLTTGSKVAGTHVLRWDGRDESGSSVSTGIYLYTLTDGSTSITKKMALMK
ncbi:MAG: T9SS type A sorting domain-containing protein [Candidatus Neomarinimicrobiota bacterium]